MTTRGFGVHTTGYTDATHLDTAAAAILADASVATVSVINIATEINYVVWVIESESTYTGDVNDFLILVSHLLLVQGYQLTSIFGNQVGN